MEKVPEINTTSIRASVLKSALKPDSGVATPTSQSSTVATPTSTKTPIGTKLKAIIRRVKSQEAEEDESRESSRPESSEEPNRKRVSLKDEISVLTTRDKSIRQKMLEEENAKMGKAKSLGFHSIKAGLGKHEYEEFLKKSPLKPLILKPIETASVGGEKEKRRSILVRMKTETSFSGGALPPLGANASMDSSITSLESATSGQLKTPVVKRSISSKAGDDYSKDDFENSSIESLGAGGVVVDKNHVAEEERLAKLADDFNHSMVAPFLLHELQSDHLIANRFGWKKSDRTGGGEQSLSKAVSKSTSDQDIQFRPAAPKLGELSPFGSMRTSVRGNLLGGKSGIGKLQRKATMANLVKSSGGNRQNGPEDAQDTENPENAILEHYSGLLYRDPQQPTTWKECNTPKKTKASIFQTQKTSLSAGRNMNAYRPWGPQRPVDPLDAILEKTINNSMLETDESDHPRSRDRHHRKGSRHSRKSHDSSTKGSSSAGHYKDRHRSLSPLNTSPLKDPRSRSAERKKGASGTTTPTRSHPGSRVSSAHGRDSPPHSRGRSADASSNRRQQNNNAQRKSLGSTIPPGEEKNENGNQASESLVETGNFNASLLNFEDHGNLPLEVSQVTMDNSLDDPEHLGTAELNQSGSRRDISSPPGDLQITPNRVSSPGDEYADDTEAPEGEVVRPESRSGDEKNRFSPPNSRGTRRKRSPLVINYVKGPIMG